MDVSTKLPAALCVAHLTKTYQRGEHRVHALADVSLSVEQGDFFGLLGPNGAGKSTLISALGALIKPDGGSVEILGRNIRDDYRFCKMAIGIVPQESRSTRFSPSRKFCSSKAATTDFATTANGSTHSSIGSGSPKKPTPASRACRAA